MVKVKQHDIKKSLNGFITCILSCVLYCLALYHCYYYLGVKQIRQWDEELQGLSPKELLDKATQFEKSQDIRTLIIDLSGDGIDLLDQAIYWNIKSNDFSNAVKWVGQGNALLVIDKNGNGTIDDHSEVLGGPNKSGFDELATFDDNGDKKIDEEDPAYKDIKLWNRKLQLTHQSYVTSKMISLKDASIKTLHLKPQQIHYDWERENKGLSFLEMSHKRTRMKKSSIAREGTAERDDGSKVILADVKLHFDTVNTVYSSEYTKDTRVKYLPNIRGYGQLPDLHIAMSLDNNDDDPNSLLSLVKTTQNMSLENMFVGENNGFAIVEKLLYRWAKADNIPINSRGWNANARRVAFLEAYVGRPFRQLGMLPNPRPNGGHNSNQTYLQSLYNIGGRLLVLGQGKDLFNEHPYYHPRRDSLTKLKTLNVKALERLTEVAKDKTRVADPFKFWVNVTHFIDGAVKLEKLHPQELLKLDRAIRNTLPEDNLETVFAYIEWKLEAERLEPFERKGATP